MRVNIMASEVNEEGLWRVKFSTKVTYPEWTPWQHSYESAKKLAIKMGKPYYISHLGW